jgi:hypothetical protein
MRTSVDLAVSGNRAGLSARRSVAELLAPLDRLVARSPNLVAQPGAWFQVESQRYELPRYCFVGPAAGDEPIRVGVFAALHGDEPEGAYALVRLAEWLEQQPDLVAGFCLFLYPVCNPTGLEDATRHSRRGRDLNREFWSHSAEPEVELLERELACRAFHGTISLHTDDTSHGVYGFASGATLTTHLLRPALAAAELVLPRNRADLIDGFDARDGIIRQNYPGVLRAPPGVRPRPFEIILETPKAAPEFVKEQALAVAVQTILTEYRKLMAYAPNL